MELTVTRQDAVAVVAPAGVIDTRGASAFERAVVELLDAQTTRIVVDLQKVTLVTSAGLRVLVMTAKRLRGVGGFALAGLSPHVRTVFDVSGLLGQFTIAESTAAAVAAVASDAGQASGKTAGLSRLSRLLLRLLGSGEDTAALSGPASTVTALAAAVTQALAGAAPPSRE